MKIAVIKSGGKQYKVAEGQTVKLEKLPAEVGGKVEFETLLISSDDGKDLSLGKPFLGNKVTGEVLQQGQGEKVVVVKYKNKTRYKRTKGHRQLFTAVKITSIA